MTDELVEAVARGIAKADCGEAAEWPIYEHDAQAALAAHAEWLKAQGLVVVQGWQDIASAPTACHVLATRFSEDHSEWITAVVLSPPIYPYTHWMPLPGAPIAAAGEG